MEGKDVKATLKLAREAIRSKDFKEALRHCKTILKEDRTNYNALVFLGVCFEGLQQGDQAVAAYHKAIEIDNTQPLAWQGLCGFYEKDNVEKHREDLVRVYEKLMELSPSDDKKLSIGSKLLTQYTSLGKDNQAIQLAQCLLKLTTNNESKHSTLVTLANLLEKCDPAENTDHTALLIDTYRLILECCEDDKQSWWKKLISLMVQSGGQMDSVINECTEMSKHFHADPFPFTTLCHAYLDSCITSDGTEPVEHPYITQLESLEPNSALCKLIRGYHSLLKSAYIDACTLLEQGLKMKANVVSGWLYVAQVKLAIHHNEEAQNAAEKGLQLLKKGATFYGNRKSVTRLLRLLVVMATVEKNKSAKEVSSAEAVLSDLAKSSDTEQQALFCLGTLHLKSGDVTQIDQISEQLQKLGHEWRSSYLDGCSAHLQHQYDRAQASLQRSIELNACFAASHFQLAQLYWERRKQDGQYTDLCLTTLLKAARLDPFRCRTFLYLGHFYSQVVKDKNKAKRCYEKAYELDRNESEAGIALVDVLSSLGEQERVFEVLKMATSNAAAGSCKWAWLRLGLVQLRQNEPGGAIVSLQSALRADPQDSQVWECLGEAYTGRGSHTAALKAFTRATELNPDSVYCFYKIACIKQAVGMFSEAIDEYNTVLDTSPDYVPALKGLGETYLLLARSSFARCLQGRALDHSEAAVSQLTKAVSLRPDLSCVWKLLGDVLTEIVKVQDDKCRMEIPLKLITETDKMDSTTTYQKEALLALGGRCYGMALKLQPDSASLWHDLGVNMSYQARQTSLGQRFWWKAVQALQKAVSLDQTDHTHWTALGVICATPEVGNLSLAQHCFIRSLQVNANNVEAWANLGCLYLVHDKIKQAHEAFKMAQRIQPAYVQAWIGQALIAEKMGDADAMDLFRHSTELANHVEGAVGYAHWVCVTLEDDSKMSRESYQYSIIDMAAVPAASDALARHTGELTANAVACNMHGLLLERQGLVRSARDAFKRTVEILDNCQPPGEHLTEARMNYARVLCKVGDYEESIRQYKTLTKLDFNSYCGLGLACYKADSLDGSQQAYEEALKMSPESHKVELLVALGMIAYKRGNWENAKCLLLQCVQLSPTSLIGLRALTSLGLLQQDVALVSAAIDELRLHENVEDDVVFLTAMFLCLQGDEVKAKRHLVRCVHSRPHCIALWRHLAEFLVKRPHLACGAAAHCAMATLTFDPTMSKNIDTTLGLSAVGSGWLSVGRQNALRITQRSLHMYPDKLQNWCVLLAALVGQEMTTPSDNNQQRPVYKFSLPLATHLLALVEEQLSQQGPLKSLMESLHVWCVKQYTVALLVAGRTTLAEQFLRQATWLYDTDQMLQSLLAYLEQNFATLKLTRLSKSADYAWQLLVSLYSLHELTSEQESCYLEWISAARYKSQKLYATVKLAYLAYRHIMQGTEEHWMDVFSKHIELALKLDVTCTAAHLMKACVHLTNSKTQRLARHCFQQVLDLGGHHTSQFAVELAKQHLEDIQKARIEKESTKVF